MQHRRSRSLRLLFWLAASMAWHAGQALAQTYPEKPARIVIGFAPGGAVDFVARLFGQNLSESMGQALVIENRRGAATSISAPTRPRSSQ